MTEIHIRIGGEPRSFAPGTTVGSLVEDRTRKGVAVARNGEVVPRDHWDSTELQDGDDVEIVKAIQGGSR